MILLNDFLSEDVLLFSNVDCNFITRNEFSLIFFLKKSVEDCKFKKFTCKTFPSSHVFDRIVLYVSCSILYLFFFIHMEAYSVLYFYIYLDFVY